MTEKKLTEAIFSMQCSFIAKNAAAWAGDLLTLPEQYDTVSNPRTVARFTDDMRGRLDRLDKWAGRTIEPSKPQIDRAIEAYLEGKYLDDLQVLASVTAIVRAALNGGSDAP